MNRATTHREPSNLTASAARASRNLHGMENHPTQQKRSRLAAVGLAASLAVAGMAFGPSGPATAGNGSPQGAPDYHLNIIGTGSKNPSMTGNSGHRIFVPLEGKTKINLVEGSFAVLDANGTDSNGATFSLPAPGLDAYVVGDPGTADVQSAYSVFVRPLGKPGGWATITTCADLVDSTFAGLLPGDLLSVLNRQGDLGGYCSIEQVGADVLTRQKGKSSYTNVTAQLTTIVFEVTYDTNNDGIADDTVQIRVPLFNDIIQGEYWEYDNHGLRLAQVEFYDCSTNVETGASTC